MDSTRVSRCAAVHAGGLVLTLIFFAGLTPTLVKVVPAVAISYAVYDASKKVLFGQEQDHHAHHDDECEES